MARRRPTGRFPALRQGQRRQTLWIGTAMQNAPTAMAASSVLLHSSLNAAALALRPFTIVRNVGFVAVKTDQTANTEVPIGGVGKMVPTDQASAAGVASLPDPSTEVSSDSWLMYQAFACDLLVTSAIGSTPVLKFFPFDSRAMRKVEDGFDVVTVLVNASGTAGLEFVYQNRMLVKLH